MLGHHLLQDRSQKLGSKDFDSFTVLTILNGLFCSPDLIVLLGEG